MPLYDYSCTCGSGETDIYRSIDDRVKPCIWCNQPLRPAIRAPADHTFPETFFEHLGSEGTLVSTRRQLREETNKQGKYSYLLDG